MNRAYRLIDTVSCVRSEAFLSSDKRERESLLTVLQQYEPMAVQNEFFRQEFPTVEAAGKFIYDLARVPEGNLIGDPLMHLCGFRNPVTPGDVTLAIRDWFAVRGQESEITAKLLRVFNLLRADLSPVDTTQPN